MKNRLLFLAFLFAVSLSACYTAQTDVLPPDTISQVNVRLFSNPTHGITHVNITAHGPATIWVSDRFGRVRLLREEDAMYGCLRRAVEPLEAQQNRGLPS